MNHGVTRPRIALLSGADYKSPRMLAESLQLLLTEMGYEATIFYQVMALRRLNSASVVRQSKISWFLNRLLHFSSDINLFRKLRSFDLVILCGSAPYAFYKETFNIPRFKSKTGLKVLLYSVQYLGNAPTLLDRLKKGGHDLLDRYDWHLSVSEVTEIRTIPSTPWSQIGFYLRSTGLAPCRKEKFLALVDFPQPGHEYYRDMQIRVLKELGIEYIALEGEMTATQIRDIYRKASALFIQSREAFGLPIAECLACGALIFTAESSWPMSWRLDDKPEIHGPGTLPDCFIVYEDEYQLKLKLQEILRVYDGERTPRDVFNSFYSNYPSFYDGNREGLEAAILNVMLPETR